MARPAESARRFGQVLSNDCALLGGGCCGDLPKQHVRDIGHCFGCVRSLLWQSSAGERWLIKKKTELLGQVGVGAAFLDDRGGFSSYGSSCPKDPVALERYFD